MIRLKTLAMLGSFTLLAGLLLSAGAPSTGWAQSRARYKKQIQSYDEQLDELAKQDEWGISKEVRNRASGWLKDTKVLLKRGSTETAGLLVKQVDQALDLVKAMIKRKQIEHSAKEQKQLYKKQKNETIPKLNKEIDRLRTRKQELKQKLKELEP